MPLHIEAENIRRLNELTDKKVGQLHHPEPIEILLNILNLYNERALQANLQAILLYFRWLNTTFRPEFARVYGDNVVVTRQLREVQFRTSYLLQRAPIELPQIIPHLRKKSQLAIDTEGKNLQPSFYGRENEAVVALQPLHTHIAKTLEQIPLAVRRDLTVITYDHHVDAYLDERRKPIYEGKTGWINKVLRDGLAKRVIVVCSDSEFAHRFMAGQSTIVDSHEGLSVIPFCENIQWNRLLQTKHVFIDVDVDVAEANAGCEYSLAGFLLLLGLYGRDAYNLLSGSKVMHLDKKNLFGAGQIFDEIYCSEVMTKYRAHLPGSDRPSIDAVLQSVKNLVSICKIAKKEHQHEIEPANATEITVPLVGSISEILPDLDFFGEMLFFQQELVKILAQKN